MTLRFMFVAVLLLTFHLDNPRRGLLLGSAIFYSLALMTRFIGAALLPPIVLALGERATVNARAAFLSVLLTR